MKLREEEFYEKYHHHGGTTIIPTEIFNELYDDATEEIERLTAESTKWECKFYDEAKKVDKAIEYIETHQFNFKKGTTTFGSERLSMEERKLIDILRGVDKE